MSHSIGHRGECSHDGGVADNPLDLILGIAAGFVAYRVWGSLTARRAPKTPEPVAIVDDAAARKAEVIRNLAANLNYYDPTHPAYGMRDYYTGPATRF
jgi:hypothetical protein